MFFFGNKLIGICDKKDIFFIKMYFFRFFLQIK